MMSNELIARANAKREWFRVRESIKGTGWHPDDTDSEGKKRSPEGRGLPRCSESVVYFYTTWDFRFVADDVAKVLAAIQHRCDDIKEHYMRGEYPDDWMGNDRDTMKWMPTLEASQNGDGVPMLIVPQPLYNVLLWVLEREKIGITGLPLVEPAE